MKDYNPKIPEYNVRLNALEIGVLEGLLHQFMKGDLRSEQIGAKILEKLEAIDLGRPSK